MARKNWDEYYMDIARKVAERSTCDRMHVGAVIADPILNRIVSTGYNGSMRKRPHCDDVGHQMENNHCIRTTHAEANAIASAARAGNPTNDCIAYVTVSPCWGCYKLLVTAGMRAIVVGIVYNEHDWELITQSAVGNSYAPLMSVLGGSHDEGETL
jgi:dCMP deaminase